MPDYRYNDRGVQRALADNEAATYEFLVANGVEFVDQSPDNSGGARIRALGEARKSLCLEQGTKPRKPGGRRRHRPHAAARGQRSEEGR